MFPYFKKNFLDAATCTRIIALAQASEEMFERDENNAFWDKRVIHVLRLPDSPTKHCIIDNRRVIKHALLTLLGTQVALYADTLQIVRWPAGYALQPHADKEHPDGSAHPYPYRDFASIVYLNADFEGGEIYFPRCNLVYKPEPGTLVLFPGTLEFLHGVRDIAHGMRYTLASFFTFDGRYHKIRYPAEDGTPYCPMRMLKILSEELVITTTKPVRLRTLWVYSVHSEALQEQPQRLRTQRLFRCQNRLTVLEANLDIALIGRELALALHDVVLVPALALLLYYPLTMETQAAQGFWHYATPEEARAAGSQALPDVHFYADRSLQTVSFPVIAGQVEALA